MMISRSSPGPDRPTSALTDLTEAQSPSAGPARAAYPAGPDPGSAPPGPGPGPGANEAEFVSQTESLLALRPQIEKLVDRLA
ncbi:hypothetical protein ACWDTB_33175, partial [Streptomyces sp. NPDC003487]